MEPDAFQAPGPLAFGSHGKQFDGGAQVDQGADYLLHVNRAAFAAEDWYAQVGANIGDPHQPIS